MCVIGEECEVKEGIVTDKHIKLSIAKLELEVIKEGVYNVYLWMFLLCIVLSLLSVCVNIVYTFNAMWLIFPLLTCILLPVHWSNSIKKEAKRRFNEASKVA